MRHAVGCGVDLVWGGERTTVDSPARLAMLAAATSGISLGMGLAALTERETERLRETLTTVSLIAPGRVELAVSLPAAVSASSTPSWVSLLAEVTRMAREAGVVLVAGVDDVATAARACEHVDRLIVRAVDVDGAAEITRMMRVRDAAASVEVWLDAAVGEHAGHTLRAVVAERLAVPGVPGHVGIRSVVRRLGLTGLQGDVESAYATGRLDRAAALVPDALVEATCLIGEGDPATSRLSALAEAGVTRVAVLPHAADAAGRHAVIEAFTAACPRSGDA